MSDIITEVVEGSNNETERKKCGLSVVLNQYSRDPQLYCVHRVPHCAVGTQFDVFH
jgi:hypothetical protein